MSEFDFAALEREIEADRAAQRFMVEIEEAGRLTVFNEVLRPLIVSYYATGIWNVKPSIDAVLVLIRGYHESQVELEGRGRTLNLRLMGLKVSLRVMFG
ncbi:MAG: hypothetical protein NVS3B1_29440 [Marmoricola sp.]